jgi:hypothetical protein
MTKKVKQSPETKETKEVRILISTGEYLINGIIHLPLTTAVESPTAENLLFHALNCGNKFIALYDGIIMNKNQVEYKPENFKYYNINLDIVRTCKIVEEL